MAQTGFTPILTYGSTTAAAVPLAANLSTTTNGVELAVNAADGKLYYKDSGGVVQVLAGKGGTGVVAGANTQIQFNDSGVFGASAGLTWDGTSLTASNYVSAGNITINTNKFTVAGATGNTVIAGSATVNSLTSGRVTFAGASGLLSDSANLTWNGSTLAITGAVTATTDSTFNSTGALQISSGTTAQRPTGAVGKIRWNSDLVQYEGYNGTSWSLLGGAVVSNDTTTATYEYPVFAAATSGNISTVYTSNAKYLYKPSTGELQASLVTATNGIHMNSQSISTSVTIPVGYSANSTGPITIASGQSVTVSSGSRWVVL